MKRGGYRAGSGRKKGFAARNAEEARRLLSDMVMREITPIGEALVKKARTGDVAAVRELFDRAFGRPSQGVELEVNAQNLVEQEKQRTELKAVLQGLRR